MNSEYIPRLEQAGLRVSAVSAGEGLCEMIELPEAEHPWFVACQFHPEFKSKPLAPHPLFESFIRAAYEHRVRDEATGDRAGSYFHSQSRASIVLGVYRGCCQLCE